MKINIIFHILGFYSCITFTSCITESNVTPNIYNLSSQIQKEDTTKKIPLNDSTSMLLSVKSGFYKSVNDSIFLPTSFRTVYNSLSLHIGIGSINVKNTAYNASDGGLFTMHLDYERYFKRPGFGIGLFYSLYGESSGDKIIQELYLHSFGPKIFYKIRSQRLIIGLDAGAGGAVLKYFESASPYTSYSDYTFGTAYNLNLGFEILITKKTALSIKFNHSGSHFSNKKTFVGDGNISTRRNAVLLGFTSYF